MRSPRPRPGRLPARDARLRHPAENCIGVRGFRSHVACMFRARGRGVPDNATCVFDPDWAPGTADDDGPGSAHPASAQACPCPDPTAPDRPAAARAPAALFPRAETRGASSAPCMDAPGGCGRLPRLAWCRKPGALSCIRPLDAAGHPREPSRMCTDRARIAGLEVPWCAAGVPDSVRIDRLTVVQPACYILAGHDVG